MRALSFLMVAVVLFSCVFYMENYRPETMKSLLLEVDVLGLTQVGKQEQQRLGNIKNLSIPYEEKQVLVKRTVFMGATCDMVKLALGEPRKTAQRMWEERHELLNYYIYYLPDDTRPTILVFQDNKLINAYKGSALDVGN